MAVELGYATVHFAPTRVPDGPSLFDQLDAAVAVGFDFVALDRNSLFRCEEEGQLERLAEACGERLPCRELQALVIGDYRWGWEEQVERVLRQASLFRPDVVSVVPMDTTAPDSADLLAEAGRALVRELPGVRLGIEFSPVFTVPTIAAGRELCERIGEPAFGLIVDSWHFFHGDESWGDLAALPLEEIVMVQFSDHGKIGPEGLSVEKNRRELPGLGRFALDRFAGAVLDRGFEGGVVVEVVSERLRSLSAVEFARLAFEASAPFWR